MWGDPLGGAVEWSSGGEPATSPITGEPVEVWRGKQASNGNSVELSVAVNSPAGNPPVTLYVNSPQWLTIGASKLSPTRRFCASYRRTSGKAMMPRPFGQAVWPF